MTSLHVGASVRTIVAVILFGFGVMAGTAFNAVGSPTSSTSCATDTRAQAAHDPTWAVPPQGTGRPGEPF
jgi:hypothetical protein